MIINKNILIFIYMIARKIYENNSNVKTISVKVKFVIPYFSILNNSIKFQIYQMNVPVIMDRWSSNFYFNEYNEIETIKKDIFASILN